MRLASPSSPRPTCRHVLPVPHALRSPLALLDVMPSVASRPRDPTSRSTSCFSSYFFLKLECFDRWSRRWLRNIDEKSIIYSSIIEMMRKVLASYASSLVATFLASSPSSAPSSDTMEGEGGQLCSKDILDPDAASLTRTYRKSHIVLAKGCVIPLFGRGGEFTQPLLPLLLMESALRWERRRVASSVLVMLLAPRRFTHLRPSERRSRRACSNKRYCETVVLRDTHKTNLVPGCVTKCLASNHATPMICILGYVF